MRETSRRALLAAACSLGLAGCLSDGGSDDGAEPGATPTPSETTTPDGTRTTPTETRGRTPTPTETQTRTPSPTETPVSVHEDYETTEVTVRSDDGEELGSVTAAIADTADLRYLGLSDTESLPEDRGMLFVFNSVQDLAFVMRDMDFGIDIVYADADGEITRIHHAPEPGPDEDGNDQRYPGRGQYVLEVNYDWTTERGVEAGDVLDFEL